MSNSSIERLDQIGALLSEVKSVDVAGGDSEYEDLKDFIGAYSRSGERRVLAFMALPGVGKTRLRHLANTFRQEEAALKGIPLRIGIRTWEHGEVKARRKGLVQTPFGQPWMPRELRAASDCFEKQISDSVRIYDDTEIEAVVMTALNVRGLKKPDSISRPRIVGRDIGFRALYKLVRAQGKEFINLPPFEVWAAGLTAGPFLREVVPPYRDAVRETASLDEAQALAILCGLDYPRTEAEWVTQKKDGASFDETMEVRREFQSVIVPIFEKISGINASDLTSTDIETALLKFIITNDKNLGISPNRRFIGINDPSPILPDKELLNDFVNSRGRLRLTESQRDLLLDHISKSTN